MSRITKAKELLDDKNVFDVLNLWDNTDSNTDEIAQKLNFSKKEVELILLTYEATKMSKGINQKPNFILLAKSYFNVNDIVYISEQKHVEQQPLMLAYQYSPPKNNETINVIISFKNGSSLSVTGMTFEEVIEKIKEI